jgi:GT2 family glycosyltransferase
MVSILITTFNSAQFIERCLDAAQRQSFRPLEIIVVDNASADGTCELLSKFGSGIKVIRNDTNTGFAAAQNQAARSAQGRWLLSLNPDVVLDPNFIAEGVSIGELNPKVGAVCGKLLRWNPGADPEFTKVIDSTGIYFLPNLRHLDRGAGEPDQGQFEMPEYVFGATGAAVLYRRSMFEDVSVDGEFFDEQFFAYREDADLAWRAQIMGWRCLYTPQAVAWHVRRVTPERRSELPTEINWHSIKNRFLMRAKNISWRLYASCLVPTTLRDAQVIGYCLLVDRRLASSLAAVWKSRHKLKRKRHIIQAHRRVSDRDLLFWFSGRGVGTPFSSSEISETGLQENSQASISAKSRSY